jgi:two-component system, chemotaxis family, protein-glutamate methylesterase/glutaminase
MPFEHLVTIGASSGGIEALSAVIAALPADFPAPICVVIHTAADSPGMLHLILGRAKRLPAEVATSGAKLEAGHIYVAPADRHMLVEPGTLVVAAGPKENRVRPAIDPLFRSAAQVYGPRVIGVIMTGGLDDGTAGLWAIKQLGGIAVVQDPKDALFPSMPSHAIRHVNVDYCVPLEAIGPLLVRLTGESVLERQLRTTDAMDMELKIAKGQNALDAGIEHLGTPSPFACPECHGVLRQFTEGDRLRYRCHTGHAFSLPTLLADIDSTIEDALWNAIRAMEERARLLDEFASSSDASAGPGGLDQSRQQALRNAATLRDIVTLQQADQRS